ncbi:ubiquinone biosynthesis accessory factor UbiJ [Spirabiliibacterium falconis]|uniref:ubiquinone biosynthesis accessory factor UbiJ n=1 Tax=Spirabiliibacterium falconis TaxID=572023 RepID=UPI001AAC4A0F|nr:SCP2 sterol-binding domain-containing protein [Spirabiliibacterium falconis]MBE2894845.1 SCP-2 sterol transfer family protein [Spirabiliibacterium falconis]
MAVSLITQLMLPQMGNAVLETLLNQIIKRSPNAKLQLQRLAGKVLLLEFDAPQLQHYFIFSHTAIDVLHHYSGEVDCHLITRPTVLIPPPKKAQISQLINDKRIVLHGDLQILQEFTALLDAIERDPAELLSPYFGDVLTHKATYLFRQVVAHVKEQSAVTKRHWGERLTEEWQVAMPANAVNSFRHDVHELSKDEQRLSEKIDTLYQQIKEQH